MILQYRLPFDVPELGAAGDVIVVDVAAATVERAVQLDYAPAISVLSTLIPHLQPVGNPVHPAVATAVVRALCEPERDAPRRLRLA